MIIINIKATIIIVLLIVINSYIKIKNNDNVNDDINKAQNKANKM